jgi:hypothetical protein
MWQSVTKKGCQSLVPCQEAHFIINVMDPSVSGLGCSPVALVHMVFSYCRLDVCSTDSRNRSIMQCVLSANASLLTGFFGLFQACRVSIFHIPEKYKTVIALYSIT